MKSFVLGLMAVASLGLAGCDEDPSADTQPRKTVKTAPAVDVRGRWEMDADGFVDENWEMLARGARKGVEPYSKERERIATLRVAERTTAEQALQAKIDALPTDQRAAVQAALGSPEDFKAWVKSTLGVRMNASSVSLEFFAGGGCRFVLGIPGKDKEDAKGTWTQQGDRVTVKMATVNGKPAKAKDAQPVTLVLRGEKLTFSPTPGAPKIVARRAA